MPTVQVEEPLVITDLDPSANREAEIYRGYHKINGPQDVHGILMHATWGAMDHQEQQAQEAIVQTIRRLEDATGKKVRRLLFKFSKKAGKVVLNVRFQEEGANFILIDGREQGISIDITALVQSGVQGEVRRCCKEV